MDFIAKLLLWYKKNGRQLPMRQTKEPYKTWVSEVIFQQTRLEQGIPYYNRFLQRFPSIDTLANANEDEVLAAWQGLGYYSRARNLHETAKIIVKKYNSNFPNNYNEIIKLKGIGKYTAAAIASWCFGEKKMAIDGNVYRVLARFFDINKNINKGDGQRAFDQLGEELIIESDPGEINQALIDLGATVCLPVNPNCLLCPLDNACLSLKRKTISERPVKTAPQKVKPRYFTYYVIIYSNAFLMRKRTANDIWKGLYEFPLIEFNSLPKKKELINSTLLEQFVDRSSNPTIEIFEMPKHILSHQVIISSFVIVKVDRIPIAKDFIMVEIEKIDLFPVPVLLEKFLKKKRL